MGALLQNKKMLIGGVVIVGGVILLYFFSGSIGGALPSLSSGSAGVEGESSPDQQAAVSIERELIDELLNLKNISLDRSAIDDPSYMTLEDFSRPIEPEPVGRPNPFLPFLGQPVPEVE